MKHIIVGNGDIYTVSNEFAKRIEAAFAQTEAIDGDMSEIIESIRRGGKLVGSAFMVIRN